jgi:2-iminoacetate synthase ThiH
MRYRQDPQTNKLLTLREWGQKYPEGVKGEVPYMYMKGFTPYVSMTTDKVINNYSEHLNDLHASGCRVYEGRETEVAEAERYKQGKDDKLWANVHETLAQTSHDIDHGYITPAEPIQGRAARAETWDFADAEE